MTETQANESGGPSVSPTQTTSETALMAEQFVSSSYQVEEDPATCLLVKGDLVRVSEEYVSTIKYMKGFAD